MSKPVILGMNGTPMNGQARKTNVVYTVPDLPTRPDELETVANGIETAGVQRPSEAFMVAMCRALAKALRRIEQLEPKGGETST